MYIKVGATENIIATTVMLIVTFFPALTEVAEKPLKDLVLNGRQRVLSNILENVYTYEHVAEILQSSYLSGSDSETEK